MQSPRAALRRALALAVVIAALAVPAPAPAQGTTDVQFIGLNDFHGNLEPIPETSSSGRIGDVPAGGIEYLATHVKALEATNPNTVVASAGDLIGASPLTSALFHDEPTIEAMNLVGLDVEAVGNHDFDDGLPELLRMRAGGCNPDDGCTTGHEFAGSDFPFLAANVVYTGTPRSIFPRVKVFRFGGVRVAVIGMTLQGTPTIVSSDAVAGLTFRDEARTANWIVRLLREKRDIQAFVVLVHEGGFPTGGFDECPEISGAIEDIVHRTTREVDAFITGHTHQAYNCVIDGRPVTSAASFGRLLTDLDLTLDDDTGEVVHATARNTIVTRDVPKAPALTELVERYRALAAPKANAVVGAITASITREPTPAGETPLGDLIADSQLAATAEQGAVVAFMNPGGIRADLDASQISGGEDAGEVTFAEMFAVQPFGNSLVTLDLTGAQIDTLLEQQWQGQEEPRVLQVSEGFSYAWDPDAPVGERVDPASITVAGEPIDLGAAYRVTVNSFLAGGGDNFTVLAEGRNAVGGDVDVDAFKAYLAAVSPVAPPATDRIRLAG